jgi:hypothetical protein
MNTTHNLKKIIVGALLSGGVALAGLGMTAGTAAASPQSPDPSIDHSDFGIDIVQCNQCQRQLPNTGGINVNPAKIPGAVQGAH